MANTFNEGIRLKEAFQSEISAIRISRPVTNFELFAQESSVRNNDVGGGEEGGGGGGGGGGATIIHLSDRGRQIGVKLRGAVTLKRTGRHASS